MKHLLLVFFLTSSMTMFSQSKEFVGSYEFYRGDNDNHYLIDRLTLNPNGTFLFSSESYIEERMDRKRIAYGKGIWSSSKRLISLSVKPSDLDGTHKLDLNNTKLRYDTKSPRDKSNRKIKTSVRIINTKISRFKGRTLIKNATTTPSVNTTACCKSIWQVHSYLTGKWAAKEEANKEYHYTFEDEKGLFIAYEKNAEGVQEVLNNGPVPFKIIKTNSGFQIAKDFEGLKIVHDIKSLDDTKLITVRKDGKESTLFRIKE